MKELLYNVSHSAHPRLAILFDNLNLPESGNERYFFMYGCPTRLFPKRQGCVPRTSVMNLFLGIDVSAQVIVLKNRTLPNSILNSRLFFFLFAPQKLTKMLNPLPREGVFEELPSEHHSVFSPRRAPIIPSSFCFVRPYLAKFNPHPPEKSTDETNCPSWYSSACPMARYGVKSQRRVRTYVMYQGDLQSCFDSHTTAFTPRD